MLRLFSLMIVAILCVPFWFGQFFAQEKQEETPKAQAKSATINGAVITLSTLAHIKAGAQLHVQIELANTGQADVVVAYDRYRPAKVQFEVTDNANKPVPLTLYGKKHLQATTQTDKINLSIGSATTVNVRPGETFDLSIRNIALYYDLTLPGDYVIQVERHVGFAKGISPKNAKLKAKLTIRVQNP